MKALTALIFCLYFINNLNTQNIDPDYYDGRLWVKFDHTKALKAPYKGNGKVIDEFIPISEEVRNKYGLLEFNKSFYFTDSEILKSTYEVVFSNVKVIDELIQDLSLIEGIEYIEKQPIKHKFQNPPDDYYYVNQTGSSNYGGPFNWKWHLDQINATTAWNHSTGSSNIKIAIVDDALWTSHPDLQGKIVAQYYPGSGQNDCDPPNVSNWQQDFSHGTHVAGLAAANTNNSIGIAAIGYDVSLIGVRSANNSGNLYYTLQGVAWAADNGADVINMSFGSSQYSQTEENTMNYAYNKGIVLVGAAGNDGVSSQHYPAALTNVIAVASVDEDDQLSNFSQYGNWIDICAPGGFASNFQSWTVMSCVPYDHPINSATASQVTGKYDMYQGTSMSSPIVAGLCGLILSKNSSLTPTQVKDCILNTAANINNQNPTKTGLFGAGRIDAGAALACASQGIQIAPVADFSANATNINVNQGVNFSDLSTNGATAWTWTISPSANVNFVSGTNANSQNPVVQFGAVGTYDISLLTTNAYGSDTETKSSYIIVSQTGSSGGTGSCDTLSNLSSNDTITAYLLNGQWGTISGHNGYGDMAKGDKFLQSSSPHSYLTGAFLIFLKSTGSGSFSVKAWDNSGASGAPGMEIASSTNTYANVANNIAGQQTSYFAFSNAPIISSDYYIGVELVYNAGDTLVLSTNTNKASGNTAWEKWSDSTWHDYNSSYGMNLNHGIFPIICDAVTGEEKVIGTFSAIVYPNPAQNQLRFELLLDHKTKLNIFSPIGQLLYSSSFNKTFELDVSAWPKGTYFVNMKNIQGSQTEVIQIIR